MAQKAVVDGSEKYINSPDHPTHDTSKSGYPIVKTGTQVRCSCGEIHTAEWRDSAVGISIPGGHGRYNHYKCPNGDGAFAAEAGSKLK